MSRLSRYNKLSSSLPASVCQSCYNGYNAFVRENVEIISLVKELQRVRTCERASERASDFSFENLRKKKKKNKKSFVPVALRETMITLYRHDEKFESYEIRIRK